MKTTFYAAGILIIMLTLCNKTNAQGSANTSLSNLASPTKVNAALLPDKNNRHDLGNTNKAWKSLYLDSNIYIQSKLFISGSYSFRNTSVGFNAGNIIKNSNGEDNTALGEDALSENVSSENTAIGSSSLYLNTTGYQNTAIGFYALYSNVSGSDNVAMGQYAGINLTDGSSNTFIGNLTNCGSAGHIMNSTAIGADAVVLANNHVHIGDESITSIGGQVGWTSFSDKRIKTNIKENVPGLAFINLLKPVTYNFNIDKQQEIMGKKESTDYAGKYDINKILFTGFLAQDVEAAAKKINYDFSGVDAPKNDKDLYGLRYSDFVVPLVKAVQELSAQNDSLKSAYDAKFAAQQKEIDELKDMIIFNQSSVNGQQSAVISSASLLSQNIPNPFSGSTTINYSIQQQFSSAKIIITDKNGNALKQIILSNNKGSITVDASTLATDAYQYSLYVDGRMIATKQMILTK